MGDQCPGENYGLSICARVQVRDNYTEDHCLKLCAPKLGQNPCSEGLLCHPQAGRLAGLFDKTVCLFTTESWACKKNEDCPVYTGALCKTNLNNCPSGEQCKTESTLGNNTGICSRAGVCDARSGLCKKQLIGKTGARVGDPCKSDLDCTNNGFCMLEVDEAKYLKAAGESCSADLDCCSGTCTAGFCDKGRPCLVRNRNGYCSIRDCTFVRTLPSGGCDQGSVCHTLYTGGLCMKKCSLSDPLGCRGQVGDQLGDYECRGWNNLVTGSTPITSSPVCEPAYTFPCDFLKNSTLDCSNLGDGSTNASNMVCRDMKNKKLANKYDPNGFCLDDTASGKVAP